jgi:UDP-glucuronate decarboxylase
MYMYIHSTLKDCQKMRSYGNKKVLITGGAGFLGSHLTDKLLEQGNEVIVVDNLFTGNKANLKQAFQNERFEFLRHDVSFPLYVEVDEIFNLACPASPIHYQHDPVQTVKTSVLGAINMLGLAKRTHAKIFQASTSEIYGDPQIHPQPEYYWGNVNPIGLRSCYDEGKRCAETLFVDYARQYKVITRIARIFNTYGPRMHPQDGRVVSNFIIQALQDKDITVYGKGDQTRSFCYVDDLIDGILALMNSYELLPVNLGNPAEFTILELAEMVIKLTNSKSSIVFNKLPADDPKQRKPNINSAMTKLKWEPKVPLEMGLTKTIEYFDDLLKKDKV